MSTMNYSKLSPSNQFLRSGFINPCEKLSITTPSTRQEHVPIEPPTDCESTPFRKHLAPFWKPKTVPSLKVTCSHLKKDAWNTFLFGMVHLRELIIYTFRKAFERVWICQPPAATSYKITISLTDPKKPWSTSPGTSPS